MPSPADEPGPSPRAALALCALVIAVGAALRAIPCGNAFWLDEIWTWAMAQQIDSASGVFTDLVNSNNHPLNTLVFYWLGDRLDWAVYRLPALAAGIGTVVLATVYAWRRGRARGVAVAVLFSFCFALIQFSSEARGYAPGLFFCFVALFCLESDLLRSRAATRLGFGVAIVLAYLSQLTSLFFFAGAMAYAAARAWQQGERGAGIAVVAAKLAALPSAAFAVFYLVHLRNLLVDGGEVPRAALVTAETVGFTFGLPIWPGGALAYASLAALAVGWSLYALWRDGDPLWVLCIVVIALAPAAVLLAFRPEVIALRYFLPGIAFSLLALGDALGRVAVGSRIGFRVAAACLTLFVIGNGFHISDFLRDGRGGYLAALEIMAAPPGMPPTVIGSDHDFRTFTTLRFYSRHLPAGASFRYVRYDDWPIDGLDWLIHHGERRSGEAEIEWVDRNGNVYERAHQFEKAGVSGFYWDLYRGTGERR